MTTDLLPDAALEKFLHELTELSRKHGIGIAGTFDLFNTKAGTFDLFNTKSELDRSRIYRADGRGKWEFY